MWVCGRTLHLRVAAMAVTGVPPGRGVRVATAIQMMAVRNLSARDSGHLHVRTHMVLMAALRAMTVPMAVRT